jgi:catechol 2,3-dioxygenase-like lactoylglutathione lyase family enzyme
MPTALVHTCVRVRDVDASLRFYEALGFEERGRLNFASAYRGGLLGIASVKIAAAITPKEKTAVEETAPA